jgi:predicted secreted protein
MAKLGCGATLTGSVNGAFAEIMSINLPDQKRDDIDVTTMDSTDMWREFIPGLKDAGSLTMQLLFEKANYSKVQTAFAGNPETWTIGIPDGSTFSCSGYLNANGGEIPLDEKITQSVTLKLSGKPTFVPAV